MRPPPNRRATARGAATLSAPAGNLSNELRPAAPLPRLGAAGAEAEISSSSAPPSDPVEPQPSSSAATAARDPSGSTSAPNASVAEDGQGHPPPISSGECALFRVGDPVMASTSGKPAREAAVIEVDPSDRSRFRVAFKDKRKKGGWRDKSELSGLPRRTGAAGSTAGQPRPLNDPLVAVDAAAAQAPTGRGEASSAATAAAAAAAAAAAPAAGRRRPPPLARAFSHLLEKLDTQRSVVFALPADISSFDGDVVEFWGGTPCSADDEGDRAGSGGGDDARIDRSVAWGDKAEIRDAQPAAAGSAIGHQPLLLSGEPSAVDAMAGSSPKARKVKAKTAGTKSQRTTGSTLKTKARGTKTAGAAAVIGTRAPAARESGVVSSPPKKRMRSAATAAAAAISSSVGADQPKKKGAKPNRGSAASLPTKASRKKGWQRPKIVTPGSAEGRPEAALRYEGRARHVGCL